MKNAPTIMRNDKEAVDHAEGESRHREEVHRCNRFAVIAQKGRQTYCRFGIPRRISHPPQRAPLRNIEARHLQLAMNTRGTPGPILGNHAEDEFAQFPAHAFSSRAGPVPGEPGPVELEPGPVPSNNCLRLKDQLICVIRRQISILAKHTMKNIERTLYLWKFC